MKRGISAVAAALAAALCLAGTAAAGRPSPPPSGGTAIVAAEQDVDCLDPVLGACNTVWATWMTENTLLGAYRALPDLTYEPALVERADVVHNPTAKHPFSVTYHLKKEAVWNDGAPVSADDLLYTWHVIDDSGLVYDRAGYDRITDAVKVDEKTVTFAFDRTYPGWKALFPTVLPEHVLGSLPYEQLFDVWETGIVDPGKGPIGDGPYLAPSYTRGQGLTLVRNPRWWGGHAGYLDSVVFRFVTDTNVETQALLGGAVDLIAPTLGMNLLPLLAAPGVTVLQAPARYQEHLEFHVASTTSPFVRQAWFRQAVAYSIDRTAVVRSVYGWLNPAIEPLQSLVYFAQQPEYTPDFSVYTYDPAKVAELMTAHGCARGVDGIWSCSGVRASIGITVTSTNATRVNMELLMQAQARAAGIELVLQNLPPAQIFGPTGIPGGFYDSAVYAWVISLDPLVLTDLYTCGAASNYMGYCSQPVTDLLNASATELNAKKRAGDLNDADALLAQDVPSLPLFQRPDVAAYRAGLNGVVMNEGPDGVFWNLADWWKS